MSTPVADLPNEAIALGSTFTDPDLLNGLLARIRRDDPLPLIRAEGFVPFWLVSRHDDIMAVERAADLFINEPRQAMMPLAHEEASLRARGGRPINEVMRNLTAMDGEEHKALRAITQAYFTPKGLADVVGDIERLAAEFVGRLAGREGEADFADIAMNFPLRVIMSMLGMPEEDEPLMLSLTQQTLTSQDPEFQAQGGGAQDAMMRMFAYFQPIIADRRANPRHDLASLVANARFQGEYLPERDVFGYFLIIATAGHDTTSYALTGGMLALLRNPDQMQRLRDDPSLLPVAIEEILRWTTPVKHFCRTATADTEVAGKAIRKGDVLLLCYPSANFDEGIYPDPFTFRIDRKPNRQLSFGTGPHVCLGQYLARFELISFFRELLARTEHLELAGTPRFVEAAFVGGVKSLPIRYRMR